MGHDLSMRRLVKEALDPGDSVSMGIKVSPEQVIESLNDTVERSVSGGFYGHVLFLENNPGIVIKTAQPDFFHEWFRNINLQTFAPQVDEKIAYQDFLQAKIVHQVLPVLTAEKYKVPKPFGYAYLDKIGYVQVLERLKVRAPRLDDNGEEVRKIKAAQQELLDVCTRCGFGIIGQIHPDNAFAFPNLKLNGDGDVIWLDIHGVFPYTGRVFPMLTEISFHKDVQQRMNGETGCRFIETTRLRNTLEEHRNEFSLEAWRSLQEDLVTYDGLAKSTNNEDYHDVQGWLKGWQQRGLLSSEEVEQLSKLQQRRMVLRNAYVYPVIQTIRDFVSDFWLIVYFNDPEYREVVRQRIVNSSVREDWLKDKYVLAGVLEAHKEGLVSHEEMIIIRQEVEGIDDARMAVYAWLLTVYLTSGTLFNALEVGSYASIFFVERPWLLALQGMILGWIAPGLTRFSITWLTQKLTKQDLQGALWISSLPKLGSYISIPADASRLAMDKRIVHYTLRNIVAIISLIVPWGGWGSEAEANLWYRFEPLINKFVESR